ncbi:MAG: hypothetical protein ACKO0Z_21165 [Betaproteobacteria bacterium]
MDEEEIQDILLCGLDGEPGEAVTTDRFNRWVARAIRHHVQPLKEATRMNSELLNKYIHDQELMLAKIQGGLRVVMWIVPIGNLGLLYILYLMHKAGII